MLADILFMILMSFVIVVSSVVMLGIVILIFNFNAILGACALFVMIVAMCMFE